MTNCPYIYTSKDGTSYCKLAASNDLIKENERLRDILKECAEDLAGELDARHPEESRKYPSEKRRHDRDMDIVIRARKALQK